MSNCEVFIIGGGGLAGLCCARRLNEAGVSFQLLEASTIDALRDGRKNGSMICAEKPASPT